MRIFFYSIKNSACGPDCRWQVCPQRYLAKLRTSKGITRIQPIWGKIAYASQSLDKTPKNGDIVILYAENAEELDSIIGDQEGFDGLKKILVIVDSVGVDGDQYHRLAPRFITQAARNIDELEAVIQKMKEYAH